MENNQEKQKIQQLAACLLSFINLNGNDRNEYKFLKAVADISIDKIQQNEAAQVTSKEIFIQIFPNGNIEDASSRLAGFWKKIDQQLKEQVIFRLAEYANGQKLDEYPWVEKLSSDGGSGNLTKYRLIGIPFSKETISATNQYREKIEHDIEYHPVKDIKPSLFAKLLFNKRLELIGVRKWIMIFYPLLQVIAYIFVIVIFLVIIGTKSEPLSTKHILHIFYILLAAWFLKQTVNRFDRFLDDRIVIASDFFMAFGESDVVQELVSVNDENNNFLYKKVQLTKYSGICPVCSAQVSLGKGEPDFPRRIVGRCKESPREHVYSFDRVTLLGKKLI